MLLPKPKKGEKKDDFLARAVADASIVALPEAERAGAMEKLWTDASKRTSLGLQPQKYEGQFKISDLVVRAAGDAGADLPPGCCARVTGVALVYNVTDDYGTMFEPGCLAKTVTEKVRPGKVRLFADHEARTKTHVGTVTDIRDVGDTAVMTAVIFDTEAGRAMKEYLEAVTKSGAVTGAVTGLSVGFRSREDESITVDNGDGPQWACLFKEIELREISVTPVNAVPGSDVLAVRREAGEKDAGLLTRMLARILSEVPESEARAVFNTAYASAADRTESAADATGATPATKPEASAVTGSESSTASAEPAIVPFEERMRIMREVLGPQMTAAAS